MTPLTPIPTASILGISWIPESVLEGVKLVFWGLQHSEAAELAEAKQMTEKLGWTLGFNQILEGILCSP